MSHAFCLSLFSTTTTSHTVISRHPQLNIKITSAEMSAEIPGAIAFKINVAHQLVAGGKLVVCLLAQPYCV
jgi:hypothetical protein